MIYQTEDWSTVAAAFIETTVDVDFDDESRARAKVAYKS
jgi:hypothetical protein